MAAVVADKGYARTSVADVLARVHVSRDTFYQQFSGKEECFLAALDQSAELLAGVIDGGLAEVRGTPWETFEQGLAVYLGRLASRPEQTRVFFIESLAAGRAAQRRRFAVQRRYAAAVAEHFADDPAWRTLPDPGFAARALVASISALVTAAIAENRITDLPELHTPLVALLRHLAGGGRLCRDLEARVAETAD
ncbi:MAG: TetR/AcrR family transcriptional regulator [Micromonosporaceae bacterium]